MAASGCPTRASDLRCSRRGLVRNPAPQAMCMAARMSGIRARTLAGTPRASAAATAVAAPAATGLAQIVAQVADQRVELLASGR